MKTRMTLATLKPLSRRPLLLATWASVMAAQALAQPLPTASPESVGMSAERLGKITTMFNQEVADKKLPGAVVMVARKGKLVYSQAFGGQNDAAGAPMKPDSLFRIYSMTKPLVSTALMMLVEDGKVQLTDPVSKFLPSFKGPMVSVGTPDPVFNGISFKLVPAKPRTHHPGPAAPHLGPGLRRTHPQHPGARCVHQGRRLQAHAGLRRA